MKSSFEYNLGIIDPMYGKEIGNTRENGRFHIIFSMSPCPDLVTWLVTPLSVEIWLNYDYHESFEGLDIALRHESIQRYPQIRQQLPTEVMKDPDENFNRGSCRSANIMDTSIYQYLNFPWISGSRARVDLSVWFFTFRGFFLRPDRPVWLPSVSITEKLIQNITINDLNDRTGRYNLNLQHGVGRSRGKRQYMEDREFAFDSIKVKSDRVIAAYGILDGHGGHECSQYIAEELPSVITEQLRLGLSVPESMNEAFLATDRSFIRSDRSNAGSTATVFVWDPSTFTAYVANAGDTRAVLSRRRVALDLSKDRKATDPEEIARIFKSGGQVSMGRVSGSLAVSRAFGDRLLKDERRLVTVEPEISIVDVLPQDEFVLIATDGLWDVMSSQAAVSMAHDLLSQQSSSQPQPDLNKVADSLTQHAIKTLGSLDNVTVMILLLHWSSDVTNIDVSESSALIHSTANIVRMFGRKVEDDSRGSSSAKQSSQGTKTLPSSSNIPPVSSRVDTSVDDMMDFLLDDSNF